MHWAYKWIRKIDYGEGNSIYKNVIIRSQVCMLLGFQNIKLNALYIYIYIKKE